MRLNFKKVVSVLAGVVLLGSTVGFAAAANYPAPFIAGGSSDVAVVVGASAATSDYLAAVDLGQNLQAALASQTASGTTTVSGSVSGEAYALFTSASKLWMNDTINSVKDILTETELPTVLADGSFSGVVDADFTQTIDLNNYARLVYGQYPTSDDDPIIAYDLGTSPASQALYSSTITFNKAVNFTHADSEGETLTLFGQKFTVGTDTDTSQLVLYKSSETFSLSVGGSNPSSTIASINGADYTVELVSATDTSATIRVTDANGNTDAKEINEADSKKIQGLEVAVNLADESTATNMLSAEVTVGAQKVILKNDNTVKVGSDETSLDGTKVSFAGGGSTNNLTQLVINITAEDSDVDAITEGSTFLDPVFGSFKIEFAGTNVPAESTAREDIKIKNSGNDKYEIEFTDHTGNLKSFVWLNNESGSAYGQGLADSDKEDKIIVGEMMKVNKTMYAVIGNEDEGHLIEVKTISNDTTTATKSEIKFQDVFSGKDYTVTVTSDGQGTVTIGGKSYSVYYLDNKDSEADEYVRLDSPDSGSNEMILFPTIETSKGAKVAFYEPQTVLLSNWNGLTGVGGSNISKMKFPDGKGYSDIVYTLDNWVNMSYTTTAAGDAAVSGASLASNNSASQVNLTLTGSTLVYAVTGGGTSTLLRDVLVEVAPYTGAALIKDPAVIIFEEEDDNNQYQALVVKMGGSGTTSVPATLSDVIATYANDGAWDEIQMESDSDLYKSIDLWGALVTTDRSDSDQYIATISYPDEQIYAQAYAAAEAASITPGSTTSGTVSELGSVTVKDSEVSQVSGKNLIVIGGSCVNTVASRLLNNAGCGASFTAEAGVGADQFLIKVVQSPYSASKVAMLVAGYEAADTTKAVKYLTTEKAATDVGTALKKVTATYADVRKK